MSLDVCDGVGTCQRTLIILGRQAHIICGLGGFFCSEVIIRRKNETVNSPALYYTNGGIFASMIEEHLTPHIPGFELTSELGRGGMATVYLAVSSETRQKVAIKILHPTLAADTGLVQRFLDEGRIQAGLNHPQILKVLTMDRLADGRPYMVMEYLQGETLQKFFQRGPLNPQILLTTIEPVFVALEYLHQKGYVHRDVKPENIFLCRERGAVLMDFGIVRELCRETRMTEVGKALGTPQYMSPEQVRGERVDQRTDIYALGIIIYEGLIGKVPFDGSDSFAVGIKHIQEELPALPPSLANFQTLLSGALQKKTQKRFSGVAELRESFLFCIRLLGETQKTQIFSSDETLKPKHWHSKFYWLLMGTLLAAGFAALFVFVLPIFKKSKVITGGGASAPTLVKDHLRGDADSTLFPISPETKTESGTQQTKTDEPRSDALDSQIIMDPITPESTINRSDSQQIETVEPDPQKPVPKALSDVEEIAQMQEWLPSDPGMATLYCQKQLSNGGPPAVSMNLRDICDQHFSDMVLQAVNAGRFVGDGDSARHFVHDWLPLHGDDILLERTILDVLKPLIARVDLALGKRELVAARRSLEIATEFVQVWPERKELLAKRSGLDLQISRIVDLEKEPERQRKQREQADKQIHDLIVRSKELISQQLFDEAASVLDQAPILGVAPDRVETLRRALSEARQKKRDDEESERRASLLALAVQIAQSIANSDKLQAIRLLEKAASLGATDSQLSLLRLKVEKLIVVGEAFREPLRSGGWGPEMIALPAGNFRMGDLQGMGHDNEQPVHQVQLSIPFGIGRYEVTFDDFDRFCRSTGRSFLPDQGWGRGRRPVVDVSWRDAVEYARWLSEQTGANYRLPSESEWEYAARGGTSDAFWWGEHLGSGRANCSDCGSRWSARSTAPVGSFAANGFGLYDTAGNVWEWCQDDYYDSYQGAPVGGQARQNESNTKVIRGGSWDYAGDSLRSSARPHFGPQDRYLLIGFRVARDL